MTDETCDYIMYGRTHDEDICVDGKPCLCNNHDNCSKYLGRKRTNELETEATE
jgi:hypothetical protein